ncbi:hypothetical protein HS088_TW11G00454 [Tripterygium wilfordii]|uniref:Uncharacterized protein n=1 Tax=Tripterygium wilfordii TaxID=458696 RepID=A0A7J7D1Z8_TRIWF|nr:hypothetical protein HS088_TW11G00454 [Tripterygium wilfordii]
MLLTVNSDCLLSTFDIYVNRSKDTPVERFYMFANEQKLSKGKPLQIYEGDFISLGRVPMDVRTMTFRYKAIPRYKPWREGLTTSYASEMRKFVYLKQHAEPNAVKEHVEPKAELKAELMAELMAKLNLQPILDQASEGSVQTPTFENFDQSEESNLLESRDNVEEDVKSFT